MDTLETRRHFSKQASIVISGTLAKLESPPPPPVKQMETKGALQAPQFTASALPGVLSTKNKAWG